MQKARGCSQELERTLGTTGTKNSNAPPLRSEAGYRNQDKCKRLERGLMGAGSSARVNGAGLWERVRERVRSKGARSGWSNEWRGIVRAWVVRLMGAG